MGVLDPYPTVGPKSTWPSASTSVVQLTRALRTVRPWLTAMAKMVGPLSTWTLTRPEAEDRPNMSVARALIVCGTRGLDVLLSQVTENGAVTSGAPTGRPST